MRVALFFDGKNHMKDLRRTAHDTWLDHGAMARWVTEHVGGTRMIAAYYYTGVPHPNDEGAERRALADLLEELERRPGFFVRRFNRRATSRSCPHCHQSISYTEEKMVDTSLVAEVIQLAVADAFDVAVIFSGDLDLCPALTALHALGKQAWIATFGSQGLSRSLVRSAWSQIDLLENMSEYSHQGLGVEPTATETAPLAPGDIDQEMLRELQRAETHFVGGGGFVGAHYFIHRWKGHGIPDSPDLRRQAVQRLMSMGSIESYMVDGKTALRTPSDEDTATVHLGDEEETVEIRVTEAVRRLRTKLKD